MIEVGQEIILRRADEGFVSARLSFPASWLRERLNEGMVERDAVIRCACEAAPEEVLPQPTDSLELVWYWRPDFYQIRCCIRWPRPAPAPELSPLNTWMELDFADGRELRSFFVASSRIITRMQQNPSMSEIQAIFQEFEPIDNHRRPSTIVRYCREATRYRIEWVLAEEEQPAQVVDHIQNTDILVCEAVFSLEFVREDFNSQIRVEEQPRDWTRADSQLRRFFEGWVNSQPGYLRMVSWRYRGDTQTFAVRWQCDPIRARQPVAPDLDALRLQRNAAVRERLDLPPVGLPALARQLRDAGQDLGLLAEPIVDHDGDPLDAWVNSEKPKVTAKPPAPALKQKQVKRNTSGLRRARPDIIADEVSDEED